MIDLINLWFKRAVPEPTDKNRAVQIGVHFEEFAEMADALDEILLRDNINNMAIAYKTFNNVHPNDVEDKQELLDSLCDQIVTAVGVAHMFGFDIVGAIEEVNRSNWSKFNNGVPQFNEHGKITKGANYSPPDLSKFVG